MKTNKYELKINSKLKLIRVSDILEYCFSDFFLIRFKMIVPDSKYVIMALTIGQTITNVELLSY